MTDEYRHHLGHPCPIAGGPPLRESFTDHSRPGVYNACRYCHDDQRALGERLRDLQAGREKGK